MLNRTQFDIEMAAKSAVRSRQVAAESDAAKVRRQRWMDSSIDKMGREKWLPKKSVLRVYYKGANKPKRDDEAE